ncbi:response regulator [Desulfospira joergensenii]|uniref:response regulator n=1 Tax=Desulfospira joergensenii TaxID=53329 RepID=UPI0003B5F604|nr:response regulator [Desulfospira joergensenii]
MVEKYNHTVLIVDDEEQVGRAIARLIKRMGAEPVYVNSGRAALERLDKTGRPFSLILSDQRMPEMEGSVFLEQAKEIAPETVRFLITGYADIHVVVDAVNKGAVHRFITKPWDNNALEQMIRSGFEYHELIVESRQLFVLAKKQNKKLYHLNMELKQRADNHKKDIHQKDRKIKELKTKLTQGVKNENFISKIEAFLTKNQILSKEKIQSFHAELMIELYSQFQDLAAKSGFDMPEKSGDDPMAPDSSQANI